MHTVIFHNEKISVEYKKSIIYYNRDRGQQVNTCWPFCYPKRRRNRKWQQMWKLCLVREQNRGMD